MIACVCSWHANHAGTVSELSERLEAGETLVVAAHSLAEAYAVLTRLPAPHRISPIDAATLVKANFVDAATVIALTTAEYKRLIVVDAPSREVSGGRTYDLLIAECARKAKVASILTLNDKHFASLASDTIAVVNPAGS